MGFSGGQGTPLCATHLKIAARHHEHPIIQSAAPSGSTLSRKDALMQGRFHARTLPRKDRARGGKEAAPRGTCAVNSPAACSNASRAAVSHGATRPSRLPPMKLSFVSFLTRPRHSLARSTKRSPAASRQSSTVQAALHPPVSPRARRSAERPASSLVAATGLFA